MKLSVIILLFSFMTLSSQTKEMFILGGGFAHFDSSDGFEINMSFFKEVNSILGVELKSSYANTNEFPRVYNLFEQLEDTYWYSKSSIFNFSIQAHLIFINEKRHFFSFYGGLGYMFINTVDNSNYVVSSEEVLFNSTINSYSTFSNSLGIKYIYFFNKFGIGFNANYVSRLKDDSRFFGQHNYRTLGLFLTRKF